MRNVLPILIALLPITGGCYGKKNHIVVAALKQKKDVRTKQINKFDKKYPLPSPVDSHESPEPIDGEGVLTTGKVEHVTISSDQNVAVELEINKDECVTISYEPIDGKGALTIDECVTISYVEPVIETQLYDDVQSSDTEGESYYEDDSVYLSGSFNEPSQDIDSIEESSSEDEIIVYTDNNGDKYTNEDFSKLVVQKAESLAEQMVAKEVQAIDEALKEDYNKRLDELKESYRKELEDEINNLKTDYHNKLEKESTEIRSEIIDEYNTLLAKEKNQILDKKIAEAWAKDSYDEKLEDAIKTLEETHKDALTTRKNEYNTLYRMKYELEEKVKDLEEKVEDLQESINYFDKANSQLYCERSSLARNLGNTKEELRVLVEERNELKVMNENLQTGLGDFWDECNKTPEHDYNNPQGGNRSEDETLDETFTFGDTQDNPHPGPKKHRRGGSAPLRALLFPAQQKQVIE